MTVSSKDQQSLISHKDESDDEPDSLLRASRPRIKSGCPVAFNGLPVRPRTLSLTAAFLIGAVIITIFISIQLYPSKNPVNCTTWPASSRTWSSHVANGNHNSSSPLLNHVFANQPQRNFKIVAVVFYGRRSYVDILDCYLKRNLVSNGGLLDQVQFLVNTEDHEDLAYLDKLVDSNERYSKLFPPCIGSLHSKIPFVKNNFGCVWSVIAQPDTLYIKIDDDIIYMHDDAIQRLVLTRLKYGKEVFAVGANIVNSILAYSHYHAGAVPAYLPESKYNLRRAPTWRASELPMHSESRASSHVARPPYQGHRWLPLNDSSISETPLAKLDSEKKKYDPVKDWAAAAQQHFGLLQNLEHNTLDNYYIGDGQTWWPNYMRYNLNFAAIWGSDVAENLPIGRDDELEITVNIPRRMHRPFMVDSRALVGHFGFNTQIRDLVHTDLLDRYRAYANEMVCGTENQKRPLAEQCPGLGG